MEFKRAELMDWFLMKRGDTSETACVVHELLVFDRFNNGVVLHISLISYLVFKHFTNKLYSVL